MKNSPLTALALSFVALLMPCLAACASEPSGTAGGMTGDGTTGEDAAELRRLLPTELVGDIAYGQTVKVAYTETPVYRALKLVGRQGDHVDLWVRSSTGGDARLWLVRESGKTFAQNDNADPSTLDAHLTVELPRTETYWVVIRDREAEDNTFEVTLAGGGGAGAAVPASRIGTTLTADASCSFLIEWGDFVSRTSTCPDFGYGWYDPARLTFRFEGTASAPVLVASAFSMEKEVASWGEKRKVGWPETRIALTPATGAGTFTVTSNRGSPPGPNSFCYGVAKGRQTYSASVTGDKLTFEMNEQMQTNSCCSAHARRASCTLTMP